MKICQRLLSQFPSFTKVISSALKQCHETQKKHFTNCLNAPPEHSHFIMDHFGRNLLRGISRNEIFWLLRFQK
jgi:hypothetical protein